MQALKDQNQHIFLSNHQQNLKVSVHGKPTLNNVSNQKVKKERDEIWNIVNKEKY
jgi:hypothetical protein